MLLRKQLGRVDQGVRRWLDNLHPVIVQRRFASHDRHDSLIRLIVVKLLDVCQDRRSRDASVVFFPVLLRVRGVVVVVVQVQVVLVVIGNLQNFLIVVFMTVLTVSDLEVTVHAQLRRMLADVGTLTSHAAGVSEGSLV